MQYLASLDVRAKYFELIAIQVENNPLLAIDYLRRAFLITGAEHLRKTAFKLLKESGLDTRAKNSVEQLVASF